MAEPLPPSSPLLRRGRFEVWGHGPRSGPQGRRRRIVGPRRWATLADATFDASGIDAPLVTILKIGPANPRYPDGPWDSREVAAYDRSVAP